MLRRVLPSSDHFRFGFSRSGLETLLPYLNLINRAATLQQLDVWQTSPFGRESLLIELALVRHDERPGRPRASETQGRSLTPRRSTTYLN